MNYIISKEGMFLCELRGVVFLTWVHASHIEYAMKLPLNKAVAILELIRTYDGISATIVECSKFA